MKILFTSYRGVYVLNTDEGVPHAIHSGLGMYYGATWLNGKLYVAARHNYSDLSNNKNEKILVFNKKLKFVGTLFPWTNNNLGLHSILADPKTNDLWLTCPGSNKIILMDVKTGARRPFWPNPAAKNKEHNHFNSLTIHGDYMLINAHNGFIAPRGSVNSEVFVCTRTKTPKVIEKIEFKGIIDSHCCFYLKDMLCICASNLGQIVTENGRRLLPKRLAGYTRGIAISKNFLIVGESQRALREDRVNADGWLHIYDLKAITKTKEIHLSGIGQVAEIRLLQDSDGHHNQVPPFH